MKRTVELDGLVIVKDLVVGVHTAQYPKSIPSIGRLLLTCSRGFAPGPEPFFILASLFI